jgi:(E)-2-((N-methylformamido)methylene)succinate hydrolase
MSTLPPAAVFIHGVGLDQTMWDGVLEHLAADRELVTYNMIGHGDAPKAVGPYSLGLFVAQLAEVVDAVSPDAPVDVVGFSMGALVAQGFACTHSKRVRRLALLHSVFDRTPEERASIVARVAEVRAGGFPASIDAALERWFTPSFAGANPSVINDVRRILEANDVEAYANAYEVFATADARLVEPASGIVCDTLVLTGEGDQRSTPEMTRRLAAAMPRARAVVLPALRHLAAIEDPPVVAEHLQAFLGES